VLDVCSGLGGPARHLADRVGCRVTGLDLNAGRVAAARRFAQRVGLADRVRFEQGDALAMPFAPESFDVVMGQEAWCHVPHKPRLIAECARVLRPGGVFAFTDILRRDSLSAAEMVRLSADMAFPDLESLAGYRRLLEANGCVVEHCDDLSPWWTRVLVDRLAMYRSLGADTARNFGQARSADWDAFYAFFVGLYEQGRLGGGRFIARKR
jgi:ubiquinone/menaquinone biosynthesis C-methylase UbiE